MDELAKVVRVIRKLDDLAPHDLVIVLDGTVGQNALAQVSAFQQVADVSGIIVTKLDGTAKGGVVIALADTFGLPVHAVGVGEGVRMICSPLKHVILRMRWLVWNNPKPDAGKGFGLRKQNCASSCCPIDNEPYIFMKPIAYGIYSTGYPE